MTQTFNRKILKSITWRLLGTGAMVALAWVIIGDGEVALYIGAVDVVVKFILYYFHETIWDKIKWGTVHDNINGKSN